MSYGNRWDQLKVTERLGVGAKGQSVDQTLTATVLAGYAADGVTLTDTAIAPGDIVTSPGGGTGATVDGLGSPYEQIPNGSKDGSNTSFFLDYIPISPPTGTPPVVPFWLFVNGLGQSPYTPRYSLAPGSNHLVMTVAPKSSDEFWCVYFRGPIAPVAPTATSAVLTLLYTYVQGANPGIVSLQHSSDLPILFDSAAYTSRTFTYALSSLPTGFGSGGWAINLEVFNSIFQDSTDVLQAFEFYATVTYSDATTARLYPSAGEYPGTGGGGEALYVTNATGDGTHVVYTVTTWGSNSVRVGDVVNTRGFSTAGFNVGESIITATTLATFPGSGGTGTITIANTTVGTESLPLVSGSFNGFTGSGDYYGSVENAGASVDGNSSTYATLTRTSYYPGRNGGGITYTF